MDSMIYIGFKGKMVKLKDPAGSPSNANFVITYKGMDWSGFRTLEACEAQFPELEAKPYADDFAVVER